MGKSRRQDTKSEKSDRATIRDLRAILRSQQKQISALKKQIMLSDYADENPEDLFEPESISDLPKCPHCEKSLKEVDVGRLTLLSCKPCKYHIKKSQLLK